MSKQSSVILNKFELIDNELFYKITSVNARRRVFAKFVSISGRKILIGSVISFLKSGNEEDITEHTVRDNDGLSTLEKRCDIVANRYFIKDGELWSRGKGYNENFPVPKGGGNLSILNVKFSHGKIVEYLNTGNDEFLKTSEVVPRATRRRENTGMLIKYTHCDICGEELPDNEIKMQSACHEKCWREWVAKKRDLDPVE